MGQIVSAQFSRLFQNTNVENRAYNAVEKIAKGKGVLAPKGVKDQFRVDQMIEEHPELADQIKTKYEGLDSNLKNVFLTSTDVKPLAIESEEEELKKLPIFQHQTPENALPVLGFFEPRKQNIPAGKLSLGEMVDLLQNVQKQPNRNDLEEVMKRLGNRVPEEKLMRILKYFAPFREKMDMDSIPDPDLLKFQEFGKHASYEESKSYLQFRHAQTRQVSKYADDLERIEIEKTDGEYLKFDKRSEDEKEKSQSK